MLMVIKFSLSDYIYGFLFIVVLKCPACIVTCSGFHPVFANIPIPSTVVGIKFCTLNHVPNGDRPLLTLLKQMNVNS